MGPSPIKQKEEHGFGLGIFTGKPLKKGQRIEDSFFGGNGEVVLALFGSETIFNEHPPLREVIWDEQNFPEVPVQYPHDETAMMVPGLAAICPCTSHNYNVRWVNQGLEHLESLQSVAVNRSQPFAGAFSYLRVSYEAVRDIAAGEELTVQCGDDSYNGGAYQLERYSPTAMCLDKVKLIKDARGGNGLAAAKVINKDDVILSTPVVPIERREMEIHDAMINSKQQMLNYCWGHADSDLLLLPFGPLVSFLNHGSPNAKIRWHEGPKITDRRLQYHHEELLTMSAEQVAKIHGKGLVLDIVATREIRPDEEILVNYGAAWQSAWDTHRQAWNKDMDPYYESASVFRKDAEYLRTITELELFPLPQNTELFCFYHLNNDTSTEFDHDYHEISYMHWDDDLIHECFRPCTLLAREEDDEGEERYVVQLTHLDDIRIIDWCIIEKPYVVSNVPEHAIRLVDRPYSTDELLPQAFRHEMRVPDNLYPSAWKRKKLRKDAAPIEQQEGDEFKRRTTGSSAGPRAKRET